MIRPIDLLLPETSCVDFESGSNQGLEGNLRF